MAVIDRAMSYYRSWRAYRLCRRAALKGRSSREIDGQRGIIRSSALWALCRCRHNAHATGHKNRLDRFAKFQDRKAYAFEELVAEIASCMLAAELGFKPDFGQSAAYVENWLKALNDDKGFIFKAASEAQKAVDCIKSDLSETKAEAA